MRADFAERLAVLFFAERLVTLAERLETFLFAVRATLLGAALCGGALRTIGGAAAGSSNGKGASSAHTLALNAKVLSNKTIFCSNIFLP